MFFWIIGLILSLVVALFASQNPMMLELGMFGYRLIPISLTVIILVAALLGAVISFFFMGVRLFALKSELKRAHKVIEKASAAQAEFDKNDNQEVEKLRLELEEKSVKNLEMEKRLKALEEEVSDKKNDEFPSQD